MPFPVRPAPVPRPPNYSGLVTDEQLQAAIAVSGKAMRGNPYEDIAKSAYKAYAASTGNKNFRGEPMPEWEDLPISIRTAWETAVNLTGYNGCTH